ncbi:uncharacterized protein TNCV_3114151 [Trichonephila clavipes]|nr:uncharacterized protein TNCV_3114151 [Trichonephila clavipes]
MNNVLDSNDGIKPSPRNEEIREVVSPGSVKEKAHLINKMASETDVTPKQPYVSGRRREHREEKSTDDDACSISTLDPRRKEWILKASRANYHELVRLLREEPKLAYVKIKSSIVNVPKVREQGYENLTLNSSLHRSISTFKVVPLGDDALLPAFV